MYLYEITVWKIAKGLPKPQRIADVGIMDSRDWNRTSVQEAMGRAAEVLIQFGKERSA